MWTSVSPAGGGSVGATVAALGAGEGAEPSEEVAVLSGLVEASAVAGAVDVDSSTGGVVLESIETGVDEEASTCAEAR